MKQLSEQEVMAVAGGNAHCMAVLSGWADNTSPLSLLSYVQAIQLAESCASNKANSVASICASNQLI